MKRVVILGAGTAATIAASKLRHGLDDEEWQITAVDENDDHHYQPGTCSSPLECMPAMTRPRHQFMSSGVELVLAELPLAPSTTNRKRHRS